MLVYGVESGVYPRPLSMDLAGGGFLLDRAMAALRHRYSGRPVILLLGKSRRREFTRLFPGGLPVEGITYGVIDDRYPSHLPSLLEREVLGIQRRQPEDCSGGTARETTPAATGMLRLDELAGLMEERDLRWSSVALCGPGFRENGFLNVPAGATLGEVVFPQLKDGGWRIIEGDPMDGREVHDYSAPAGPGLRTLTALTEGPREEAFSWLRPGFDRDSRFQGPPGVLIASRLGRKVPVTALRGEERACFACGACSAACPAGLVPQRLHRLVETGAPVEDLERFRLADCYHCGLCSYLCPAKIDLAASLHRGQDLLEGGSRG